MEYSVYTNIEDLSRTEEDERNNFIRSVLENIGLDINEVWEEGIQITPENKIKIWKYLEKFDIEIIHDGDRGYKIYFENNVLGEWFKPRVILRRDNAAKKISKALYYELQLKFETVFEKEE